MVTGSSDNLRSLGNQDLHLTEADYQSILQTTNSAVICLAPDHTILKWNHGAERVFGFLAEDVIGQDYLELFLPEEHRAAVAKEIERILSGSQTKNYQNPILTKDGTRRILVWNASELLGKDRRPLGVVAIGHDVTELERARALQAGENHVLGLLAKGGSLEEVLSGLAATIEEVCTDAFCAVMLVDDDRKRLLSRASPNIPDDLRGELDGWEIGPNSCGCGLAAYRKERVVIEDIRCCADCADGHEIAIRHGVRSCWAEPILDTDGSLVGTFCTLPHRARGPDPFEGEVIRNAARLSALAVEHEKAEEEKIRQSETRLKTAVEEVEHLREDLRQRFSFEDLVAVSPGMLEVLQLAAQVAPTEATVLITGETGTGKEVLARAVHANSPRAHGPFIAINCGAIPEALIESELFGHERGAFTGADKRKPGRIERAAGGTLFLDEVGELPAQTQVKFLRVLQERIFERLGGTTYLSADVRIIAATNRDLQTEVKAGRFREDIYYRLNVFRIHVPPLRDRREAIPELAERILRKISEMLGRPEVALSRPALQTLQTHKWSGNVRELENALERAAILCGGSLIRPEHLPIDGEKAVPPAASGGDRSIVANLDPGFRLDRFEQRLLQRALKLTRGNQSEAARLLGITRSALRWKLRKSNTA